MHRIVWFLLPGVIVTVDPAAGQSTARPTPIATLEQATRTLDAGRHRLAASQFRAIAEAEPGSPRAWFGLGKSYEALAREAFQKLQAAAPESPWEALIIAEVLVSGERFAQALSLYRKVQQAEPAIGGIYEAVAVLYERAGKVDWAAAERAKASARPRDCAALPAECRYLDGKYLDAIAAAEGRADAPSLYWTTRAYNALATEAFATLDTLPPSAEVHVVLASVHRDQGRPTEAVPELKAALALRPGDRAIEEDLASALYESRNMDEALPLLARLTGPAKTARTDLAFFYGDALLRAQQVEAALPYLKAAAAGQPEAIVVRASLGRALLQSGDAAAALPHLEAAAAADDPQSDGATHYQLAQAYQRLGRADQARTALAEYQKRQAAVQAETPPPAAQSGQELTPP
jgi:predicted Zn-dependent protease